MGQGGRDIKIENVSCNKSSELLSNEVLNWRLGGRGSVAGNNDGSGDGGYG
jgi:hypothetical protein